MLQTIRSYWIMHMLNQRKKKCLHTVFRSVILKLSGRGSNHFSRHTCELSRPFFLRHNIFLMHTEVFEGTSSSFWGLDWFHVCSLSVPVWNSRNCILNLEKPSSDIIHKAAICLQLAWGPLPAWQPYRAVRISGDDTLICSSILYTLSL